MAKFTSPVRVVQISRVEFDVESLEAACAAFERGDHGDLIADEEAVEREEEHELVEVTDETGDVVEANGRLIAAPAEIVRSGTWATARAPNWPAGNPCSARRSDRPLMTRTFSVVQFLDGNLCDYVARGLDFREAAMRAVALSRSLGARLGVITRVLILDNEDYVMFYWEFGKDIAFPLLFPWMGL